LGLAIEPEGTQFSILELARLSQFVRISGPRATSEWA
jgi:hypothetical protein